MGQARADTLRTGTIYPDYIWITPEWYQDVDGILTMVIYSA